MKKKSIFNNIVIQLLIVVGILFIFAVIAAACRSYLHFPSILCALINGLGVPVAIYTGHKMRGEI